MSVSDHELRLRELRRSFDETFEKPPPVDPAAQEDLLELRVATARYLLPVRELKALRQAPHVLHLPTRVVAFAGIVRERSELLPVFDLAALLGSAPSKNARWLVLPRSSPVALSFDGFEGHRRVPATALLRASDSDGSALKLESGAIRVAGTTLAVLNLKAILNRIAAFGRRSALSEKT